MLSNCRTDLIKYTASCFANILWSWWLSYSIFNFINPVKLNPGQRPLRISVLRFLNHLCSFISQQDLLFKEFCDATWAKCLPLPIKFCVKKGKEACIRYLCSLTKRLHVPVLLALLSPCREPHHLWEAALLAFGYRQAWTGNPARTPCRTASSRPGPEASTAL